MILNEINICTSKITFFGAFFLTLISYGHTAKITKRSKCTAYPCLIFHDDFKRLDQSTWEHLITQNPTGNDEFQFYTNNRSNSFIRDGVLYLKPTLTRDTWDDDFLTSGTLDLWGSSQASHCSSNRKGEGCFVKGTKDKILDPIQSASIRTQESFSFKYGRIEVKAKLPRGDWIWPAVWLMPKYNAYGHWPASGEIDILESRGNDELYLNDKKGKLNVGNKMVQQSLHWGPYCPINGHSKTVIQVVNKTNSYSEHFHTYGLEWRKDSLRFSVDNKNTLKISMKNKSFWEWGEFSKISKNIHNPWQGGTNMAPFDQEFYIIMNVAVGGTNGFFWSSFYPKAPWNNGWRERIKAPIDFWNARSKWLPTWKGDKTALKIDYVKVWAMEPE